MAFKARAVSLTAVFDAAHRGELNPSLSTTEACPKED